jgi:hypothetical protein
MIETAWPRRARRMISQSAFGNTTSGSLRCPATRIAQAAHHPCDPRQSIRPLRQRVQIFDERRDRPIHPLDLGIAGLDQVILIRSVRAGAVAQSEVSRR